MRGRAALLLLVAFQAPVFAAPPGVRWSTSVPGFYAGLTSTRLAVDSAGDLFFSAKSLGPANSACVNVFKHGGSSGARIWTRQLCGSQAEAQGVAVDSSGDVFSVGQLNGDFYTAKHSGRDGSILWQKTLRGALNSYNDARTVEVDASGDAIVAGVTASTARDAKVVKYRGADGSVVWETTIDNGDDDDFYAFATGRDGSVAVGTRSYTSGSFRWGVAKLRADGSIAWKRTVGEVDGAPSALALDDEGNVFAAGSFRSSQFSTDLHVYRLSSSSGGIEWQRTFATVGNDYAGRVRLDGQGALFITGGSLDQLFTARLAAATGAAAWETRFQAEFRGDEGGRDIAFDDAGDILVTGSSFYQGSVSQARTVKYSRATGAIAWMRTEHSTTNAGGYNVVVRGNAIYLLASGLNMQVGEVYLTRLDSLTTATPANAHGLWWRAPAGSESGWGVNFAHQGDIVFATWFTYDADGSALWFVAPDTRKAGDNLYKGKLYRTTGPAFNAVPFDPAKVMATEVGSVTLEFDDDATGVFHYTVDGRRDSKPVTRQVFSALPTCLQSTGARGTNYQDLWWRSPAASESGWGINLTHQGDILFATWFTYDTNGKPMWLVGPNVARVGSEQRFTGPLYRTRGPYFFANFDPSQVTNEQVGTMTVAFADPEHGTFDYTVNGVTQSKPIVRQDFASPRTVCR